MPDDAFAALLASGTLSMRICRGELVLGNGAAKTYDSRPVLIAAGCRFHRPSKTWRRSATDAHRAAIAKARARVGEGKGRIDACTKEREERDLERVMDAIFCEVEAAHEWRKRWLYVGMPLPSGHQ